MSDTGLLEVADGLYALHPSDFTAARDAAAKEHKAAGEADLAQAVKALRKPSVAAWAVNQLVRREAGQVAQVLEVGDALREAQAGMSAEDLKALTRQRRQLTAAVTQQARALASDAGVRLTASVADQVEATLTAAMVDEECGRAVRSGLLVAALQATGVGEVDVAAAVAAPDALGFAASPVEDEVAAPRPDLRVVPDPDADAKALAAARSALEDAQGEVDEAQDAAQEAASAVEELEARALQTRSEIEELQRRVAELESTQEEVEEQLSEAEDTREEADSALAEVVAARDEAQAGVDRLT